MWLDEVPDDALDTDDKAPLHAQLSAVLRSPITDGSLPSGTPFPTEAELQNRFGVSRSVVRQALLALTAEGLLTRGRGRGSVVAPHEEHHRLVQRISGLSTQVPGVSTRVLEMGRERDAHAEEELATSEVLGIRRLRCTEEGPLALIHTWLPFTLASSLTPEELTDSSLHSTLRRRFGVEVVAGRRQVRAVAASDAVTELLDIAIGSPLLLLEGTSVDKAGRPIEVFRTWHRADRVVFDLDVVQPGSAGFAPLDRSRRGSSASGDATSTLRTDSSPTSSGIDTVARARALARQLHEFADEVTNASER